jgi:hypothetical protein
VKKKVNFADSQAAFIPRNPEKSPGMSANSAKMADKDIELA